MTTKISGLVAATSVGVTDVFPIVQSGVTKKATPDLLPFVPSGIGAITRTVSAKLQDIVSTSDYSTVGNFNTASDALTGTVGLPNLRFSGSTWTLPVNITETRAIGAAAAGSTVARQQLTTFTADSGGTTDVRGQQSQVTFSGANGAAFVTTLNPQSELRHSAGTLASARALEGYVRLGLSGSTVGDVTSLRCLNFHIAHEGVTGTIATGTVYMAGDVDLQDGSGTITNLYGFRSGDLGHATRITTLTAGFYAANMTAGAPNTVGFYSDMNSGTGKNALRLAGTATNILRGNTRIGDTTEPIGPLSLADGTAAAPSIVIGEEQNGLFSNATNKISVTAGGVETMRFQTTASGVAIIQCESGTTGNPAVLRAIGETNTPLFLHTSGNSSLSLGTNGGTVQAQITHTASAVNKVQITGGASGANASIKASAENLLFGSGSALATTDTSGYVMFPSCAGTPTGVPTGQGAGKIPMIFDTSGVKLWFYTGGAWKGVVVA